VSKNPSGSGLERNYHCAASSALNQAPSTGEPAIKGTENHDNIKQGLRSQDLSVLPEGLRKELDGAAAVDLEVAFALDVEAETVRLIGRDVDRNYGEIGPSEIALTIDAVVFRVPLVTVWDWKSRKRVTPAIRNWQIKAGCVAVMKHGGLSEVRGGLGYLDDGEADIATFDAFDIPVFFAEMRSMLNRIGAARALVATGGTPDVHAGPWCEYCPAMAYCPAQTRLARTMLGELTEVEKQIAFMTPEDAGRAWALLKQIQGLADKVDASLRLRAAQEVVPLPNGKRLALIDKSRASFDKAKAIAWIKEHGGNPSDFEGRTHFTQIAEVKMTG
jgi:hypothetical protein